VAQRLHDEFGYSYTNLQVLEGGWNSWLQHNSTDPTGYPVGTGSGSAAPATGQTPAAITPTAVITP
jgi:hypothetical protein